MFQLANLEARADEGGNTTSIEGYAAVFNTKANVGGVFEEVIMPGAFSRTLVENKDVVALVNHNFDNVLARTSNGLLKLSEDERGLKFELQSNNTPKVQQVFEDVKCRNLKDCSFLFFAKEEEWDYSVAPPLRIVKDVDLVEISLVTLPVYEGTEVSARSKEFAQEIELSRKMINQIKKILEGK